jgi:hypothetical protein
MIEIKFTGYSLGDLRSQIEHFLADGAAKPPASKASKPVVEAEAAPASTASEPVVEAEAAPASTASEPVVEAEALSTPLYTYADVSLAMLKYSKRTDRASILAFLARYGAEKNAQEINPALYPEVMADLDNLLGA